MIVSLLCALLQKVATSILPMDPRMKGCCFYLQLFCFGSQKMYPSYPRILGSKPLVNKKNVCTPFIVKTLFSKKQHTAQYPYLYCFAT